MKNWMESYAAKLTAGVQTIGVGLDPEVLMLPGGSIMALVLWLYEHRPQHCKTLADAPGAAPSDGTLPTDQSLH
jgi:predicted NBD/HSP70 family sugar kinase